MADINTNKSKCKIGVKKTSKASTKVDLTPMVDLGFLLITFFIFATTLATPNVAKFRVPNDDIIESKALDKGAMTALIGPNEKSIYYYQGTAPDDKVNGIKLISLSEFGKNIINVKASLKRQNIPDSFAIISLKPLAGASWGAFMNAYDEVLINDVKQYVKVKPNVDEIIVLNAYNKFNKLPTLLNEDQNN